MTILQFNDAPHQNWLPAFINAITWLLPKEVGSNIVEMLRPLLRVCTQKERSGVSNDCTSEYHDAQQSDDDGDDSEACGQCCQTIHQEARTEYAPATPRVVPGQRR
ncbi:hypothetical protein PsYK624_100730 [Phanerochaete sordida]|uniref:Uncharacterized protein n=1 Tax=Phanerochaete sordida TaxID=48140 RepID=A0A9P3GFE4_9APHY|nr:hypothetical protein PsYK624_100730 [Phanerochaete sordida]